MLRPIERHRHGDDLEDPVRLRQQADRVAAGERVENRGLVRRDVGHARRSARVVEHPAGLVRDEHQARVQLRLVAAGDVLHRRRVVGGHRRLQLRLIGDEARHQRERPRALAAKLIDLRAGRHDLALERALRLARHLRVHDEDRRGDAEDREHRAREKYPAAQRREELHRIVKSSSEIPPSGTDAGLVSDGVPSFHATTP